MRILDLPKARMRILNDEGGHPADCGPTYQVACARCHCQLGYIQMRGSDWAFWGERRLSDHGHIYRLIDDETRRNHAINPRRGLGPREQERLNRARDGRERERLIRKYDALDAADPRRNEVETSLAPLYEREQERVLSRSPSNGISLPLTIECPEKHRLRQVIECPPDTA